MSLNNVILTVKDRLFDEQSVPNTHKDTLKETLYLRFNTEGATDRETDRRPAA